MSGFPRELNLGFAEGAAKIATQAGELLRSYFERGVPTEYKGDVDIVTEADRASEKLIAEAIKTQFPGHGIFGEEGTRLALEEQYRWYVDPLDGTTNFAHGFPVFCVSLGCVSLGLERRVKGVKEPVEREPGQVGRGNGGREEDQDRSAGDSNAGDSHAGQIIAGVIYDPLRRELFAAEQGRGAWLNGRRLHVSRVEHLEESLLATGFPSHKRHANPNIHFYQQLTLRSHGVRRAGSAALDLAYCAAGRFDAYWEFNLNPWDTAAGALLVTEAGGTMTRFDASPFRLSSEEILATNGLIEGELVGFFRDMFAGRGIQPVPTAAEFAARRKARL